MPLPWIIAAGAAVIGYAVYKAVSDESSSSDDDIDVVYRERTRDLGQTQRREMVLDQSAQALVAEFQLAQSPETVATWLRACAETGNWQAHESGKALMRALHETPAWQAISQEIETHKKEMLRAEKVLRAFEAILSQPQ